MKRIRDWAEANPQRVSELLASNPSFVFFSLRPDSDEGPRGSLNVPLTDGCSVAIDRKVIPLGSLMWLSTTRPDDGSAVVRIRWRPRIPAGPSSARSAPICSGAPATPPANSPDT